MVVVRVVQLNIEGSGVFIELCISQFNNFMVAGKCLLVERLQLLIVAMFEFIQFAFDLQISCFVVILFILVPLGLLSHSVLVS